MNEIEKLGMIQEFGYTYEWIWNEIKIILKPKVKSASTAVAMPFAGHSDAD